MRILFGSKEKESLFKKIISYSENSCLAKIDFFQNYEDVEYCVEIRTYDYIFIQYYPELRNHYLNIFKKIRSKDFATKIILFSNEFSIDSHTNSLFANYNIDHVFLTQEKIENSILNLETFLKKETKDLIEKDNIQIDIIEQTVYYKEKDKEAIQIVFDKKIDFYVFLYFVRHYKETINVSSLLNATFKEPELTKDSIIEASISSIRKTFKELLNINPIIAFKKVGYYFSIT